MGLLSGLLLLPLAPVRGVNWVAGRVVDMAEQELLGPDAVRARLADLNRAYERGDITLDEFEREEEQLLDLLEAAAMPRAAPRDASATPTPSPDAPAPSRRTEGKTR
jgi:Gas vesicle protein G